MDEQLDCTGGQAPREAAVRVDGVRLSYLAWGQAGPPLLLLHGITSSARGWWRVGPALAARGYQVYALDMPGHGLSDATDDHRISAVAALVAGALRQLTDQPAALIGHSWGGATALALAAAEGRPPLRKVALIDPPLYNSPARGEQRLPGFMVGVGEPPAHTLPRLRATAPDWHPCDRHWKADALARCRAEAVRGLFLHSGTWQLTDRLADVDLPLLLLVAAPQHTVIAPDQLEAARAALRPGLGRLEQVAGTDHNMLRGGYDRTMPIVLGWLAET